MEAAGVFAPGSCRQLKGVENRIGLHTALSGEDMMDNFCTEGEQPKVLIRSVAMGIEGEGGDGCCGR